MECAVLRIYCVHPAYGVRVWWMVGVLPVCAQCGCCCIVVGENESNCVWVLYTGQWVFQGQKKHAAQGSLAKCFVSIQGKLNDNDDKPNEKRVDDFDSSINPRHYSLKSIRVHLIFHDVDGQGVTPPRSHACGKFYDFDFC